MPDISTPPLYKTTIVIWSEFDPTHWKLDSLGREASSGTAYCSSQDVVLVENPPADPDWDGTEFFDDVDDYFAEEDDEEEEEEPAAADA